MAHQYGHAGNVIAFELTPDDIARLKLDRTVVAGWVASGLARLDDTLTDEQVPA